MEEVARLLVREYAETLGRPLIPGVVAHDEDLAITQATMELASEQSTPEVEPSPRPCLKIARGVFVREGVWHSVDGPVREERGTFVRWTS
jgi:hypothetical protein